MWDIHILVDVSALYCDGLAPADNRRAPSDEGPIITTFTKIQSERHSVGGGPRLLDPPLAVISLYLGVQAGLGPSLLKVVLEPLEEVLAPVPSGHVIQCFESVSGINSLVAVDLIRVVVTPLS